MRNCVAVTKKGKQCKNYAIKGHNYCVFHISSKHRGKDFLDTVQSEQFSSKNRSKVIYKFFRHLKSFALHYILLIAIIIISGLFWKTPIDNTNIIGGSISEINKLEFTTLSRKNKFSPMCGCEADLPKSTWSGVSFMAKRYTVDFDSDSDFYWISFRSAFPAPIGPTLTLYPKLQLVYDKEFAQRHNIRRVTRFFSIANISILTKKPVTIIPDNTFPQSAWLPPSASKTQINFGRLGKPSLYISSNVGMSISPEILNSSEDLLYDSVIDIMGKNITLEIDNEAIFILNGTKELFEKYPEEYSTISTGVAKIRLKVPFAGRAWIFGANQVGNTQPDVDLVDSIPAKISKPGRLSLNVEEFLSEERFQEIKSKINRNTRIASRYEAYHTQGGVGIMNFRMPFVSPPLGIQLYGDIKELRASGVKGDITFGAKTIPIKAPSELFFKNIEPLRLTNEGVSIPLEFDIVSGGTLDFQAISRLNMNGEEVQTSAITIGEIILIISVILELLFLLLKFVRHDTP